MVRTLNHNLVGHYYIQLEESGNNQDKKTLHQIHKPSKTPTNSMGSEQNLKWFSHRFYSNNQNKLNSTSQFSPMHGRYHISIMRLKYFDTKPEKQAIFMVTESQQQK